MYMDRRQSEALDRHITGNYGEDQFKGLVEEDGPGTYEETDWYMGYLAGTTGTPLDPTEVDTPFAKGWEVGRDEIAWADFPGGPGPNGVSDEALCAAFDAGRDDAFAGRKADPILDTPEETAEYSKGFEVGVSDLFGLL